MPEVPDSILVGGGQFSFFLKKKKKSMIIIKKVVSVAKMSSTVYKRETWVGAKFCTMKRLGLSHPLPFASPSQVIPQNFIRFFC